MFRFVFLVFVALSLTSSADQGPSFLERLVEAPHVMSQRISNYFHQATEGCDKPDIQKSINADFVNDRRKISDRDIKKSMASANRYFESMSSYMVEEHQCALKAMDEETADLKSLDQAAVEKALVDIAKMNEQLKSKKLTDDAREDLVSDREMLAAQLPYGRDKGAQEYLFAMSPRGGGRGFGNVGRNLYKGLVQYGINAKSRMEKDLTTWQNGRERSESAIAQGQAEFVGQYFDTQLRQIAQDQGLFSSLNSTLKKRLAKADGPYDYDVGRCLVSSRFGGTRHTVSAYIDGAFLLGSVIPFAGWGIAVWRGYRAAEEAAILIEKGGRVAKVAAQMAERYKIIKAEKKAAKVFGRVATGVLGAGIAKTGRDCYGSCYENILHDVALSVEGQLECKKITKMKGDFKKCAVECARTAGKLIPGVRLVSPLVPEKAIEEATEGVR